MARDDQQSLAVESVCMMYVQLKLNDMIGRSGVCLAVACDGVVQVPATGCVRGADTVAGQDWSWHTLAVEICA
jgi:hypothetical protein